MAGTAPTKTPAQQRGRRGEDAALRYALNRGWTVVARNHSCRAGELDLVLRDGKALVFAEVKARRARGYGVAAVTWSKRRRLVLAALDFAAQYRVDQAVTPFRFDVVEVWLNPTGDDEVRWLSDAFNGEGLGLDL